MTRFRAGRLNLPLTCTCGTSWLCLFEYRPTFLSLVPVTNEHLYCPICGAEERDGKERKAEIAVTLDPADACRAVGEGR
jgi:hypothetical protein